MLWCSNNFSIAGDIYFLLFVGWVKVKISKMTIDVLDFPKLIFLIPADNQVKIQDVIDLQNGIPFNASFKSYLQNYYSDYLKGGAK